MRAQGHGPDSVAPVSGLLALQRCQIGLLGSQKAPSSRSGLRCCAGTLIWVHLRICPSAHGDHTCMVRPGINMLLLWEADCMCIRKSNPAQALFQRVWASLAASCILASCQLSAGCSSASSVFKQRGCWVAVAYIQEHWQLHCGPAAWCNGYLDI